jgi:hypothetical protein
MTNTQAKEKEYMGFSKLAQLSEPIGIFWHKLFHALEF